MTNRTCCAPSSSITGSGKRSSNSRVKGGKIAFKVDKAGIIHASIGRVSFSPEKLAENSQELIGAIIKAKPATAKGTYVKSVFMASSMSPGIALDTKAFAQ